MTLLLLAALWLWQSQQGPAGPSPTPTDGGTATPTVDDVAKIAEAFSTQRSDLWVESSGAVVKTLRDDTEGSQHQRFLVELSNGQTLLFAHNIDLAPRVPIEPGDRIAFRGEYEWNKKGGVIHWTHHDPQGRREGGWIDHRGRRYR